MRQNFNGPVDTGKQVYFRPVNLKFLWVSFILIAACLSAFGQNKVDGSWQGQGTGPTGQHFPLIFAFSVSDTVLNGTMISPMGGDTIALKNGGIHGNWLAFDIEFGKLKIHHSGEIRGDSIYIKTSDQNGGGMSLTLGRMSSQ